MQEAISSGLGYGGAGALQGLFDPEGTLLGGFTENAFYGALAPVGGALFSKAKGASKAAKGSSAAKASGDINMERLKETAEELRALEAMEQAATIEAATQAAAAQAAAASAISKLREASRAVRGANLTKPKNGGITTSLFPLPTIRRAPSVKAVRGVDPRLVNTSAAQEALESLASTSKADGWKWLREEIRKDDERRRNLFYP